MNTYVFCFDSNYAKYCLVALLSLFISNGNKIKVYCLHDDSVGKDDLFFFQKISEMYGFEIKIIFVETSTISRFKIHGHFTKSVYIRLLIPEILEKEDKVLYLDSDLIISKKLSDLFNLDMTNFLYAGVHDLKGEKTTKIEVKSAGSYINSGVLLMNLKKLREDNSFLKMSEMYDVFSESLVLVDQCLINKYSENRRMILDDTWNCQVYSENILRSKWDDIKNIKHIFHFLGGVKPWHVRSSSHIQDFWWSYVNLLITDDPKILKSNLISDLMIQYKSLEEGKKYRYLYQIKSKKIRSLLNYFNKLLR
jgi:lipopolysaccharide biosynthesis glycosyltransferase